MDWLDGGGSRAHADPAEMAWRSWPALSVRLSATACRASILIETPCGACGIEVNGLNPSSLQLLGRLHKVHARRQAYLPAQLFQFLCRGQALPLGVLGPLQRLLAAGLGTPFPVGHLLGITLQLEAVSISDRCRRHPGWHCCE